MDPKIARTAEYYKMVIARLERSGRAPLQLDEYRKTLAQVEQSSTKEEIEQRLKESGLDTSVGAALLLDKVHTHFEAARDAGQDEIANVYREYYDKMKAHPAHLYTLSAEYPEKLKPHFERNSNILGAVVEIFTSYFALKSLHGSDEVERAWHIERLNKQLGLIEKDGMTFEAAMAMPYFRDHIPLQAQRIDEFVSTVREMSSWSPRDQDKVDEYQALTKEALAVIKDKKRELKKLLSEQESRQKRAVFSAVAVGDSEGDYVYEEIWEQSPV